MSFSILIANYNNGAFFEACFDSILNQSHKDFEVIIVDDASTDNSVALISELIANDNRFKFYQNEKNKGCGYTKHKCATLANTEICAFLDPDDALVSNAVEVMINAFKANPNAVLISSKYYLTDIDLNVTGPSIHGEKIPQNETFLTYGKGAVTHFAAFKRAAYIQSKGIDPTFKRAVDQDLYLKLEEQGTIAFVDEYLYYYRINDNSISANNNIFKAQYWHNIAMEAAYKRRLENKTINVAQMQSFVNFKRDYSIRRIKRCVQLKRYFNKYYLLMDLLLFDLKYSNLMLDYKFKIRAIFEPNFPSSTK